MNLLKQSLERLQPGEPSGLQQEWLDRISDRHCRLRDCDFGCPARRPRSCAYVKREDRPSAAAKLLEEQRPWRRRVTGPRMSAAPRRRRRAKLTLGTAVAVAVIANAQAADTLQHRREFSC